MKLNNKNIEINLLKLIEEISNISAKVLLIDSMDRVESVEDMQVEVFNDYSYCIQTATINSNNNGEPYENIYFVFNKKHAKEILGYDVEIHNAFDYDDVQILGLRNVTYGTYLNYEDDVYIVVGWDSLVFDLDSVDPCWYDDKEKIISYIESLNEKINKGEENETT